jgi:hypothetical protein
MLTHTFTNNGQTCQVYYFPRNRWPYSVDVLGAGFKLGEPVHTVHCATEAEAVDYVKQQLKLV